MPPSSSWPSSAASERPYKRMPSTPPTKTDDRGLKQHRPYRSRSKKSHRSHRSRSRRPDSALRQFTHSRMDRASVNRLLFDTADAAKGRTEFTRFDPDAVAHIAKIFVGFGIDSFMEPRSTRADQRARFLADARKPYRFKSMRMIREIPDAPPPVKRGRDLATMGYSEILTPQRSKSHRVDFPTIDGALRPVRDMVNAISEEVARGGSNPPTFPPLHSTKLPRAPVFTADYRPSNRL